MKPYNYLLSLAICFSVLSVKSQEVRLTTLFENEKVYVTNRNASVEKDNDGFVFLDANEGAGMAMLKEVRFEKGRIELDLKGENKPGSSFIGLAFNIQNDSTYEAIYFRPFNFVGEKQIQRDHMVQYVFEPEYPWHRLRAEHINEFENELKNPPNPNEWFRVAFEINKTKVKVFVNGSEKPQLTVKRLTKTTKDNIGLWVGNDSSGSFKNLSIQK